MALSQETPFVTLPEAEYERYAKEVKTKQSLFSVIPIWAWIAVGIVAIGFLAEREK